VCSLLGRRRGGKLAVSLLYKVLSFSSLGGGGGERGFAYAYHSYYGGGEGGDVTNREKKKKRGDIPFTYSHEQ